jgi:hypothetical protein
VTTTAFHEHANSRETTVSRDGGAVVIDIPMNLRRRSGRKVIAPPPGADTAIAADPEDPSPLTLALARAIRWQEMIESGQAQSNSDLARKLKLDQSYVARTTRLASLAPNIVEAILNGNGPDGIGLNALRRELPMLWDKQREQLGLAD